MRTILSIIIIAAVLWFAIANAAAVTLKLFVWEINASLALVIGVAFFLGFLLGVVYLAPGYWRNRVAARKNEQALTKTQQERDTLAERSQVLEDQVNQLAPNEVAQKQP